MLKGISGSSGYGIGKLIVYRAFDPSVSEKTCEKGQLSTEKEALFSALSDAKAELLAIAQNLPAKQAAIFSAHAEILEDEAMLEDISAALEDEQATAEWAVFSVYNAYSDLLKKSDNVLLRQRADDLKDVRNRILRNLRHEPERNLSVLCEPVIVAAYDILPSDVATLNGENVLAFLTQTGGATSHAAILARSFGIPAVLGIPLLTELVRDGQTAVVDGQAGTVLLDPDEEELSHYCRLQAAYERKQAADREFLPKRAETKDGVFIPVGINIGSSMLPESAAFCDGVGLFRTEFLYMEKETMPDEETQFAAYASVLRAMGERPVILRTLDIGGDKTLPYLPLEKEENPFLGNRAIRLCLSRRELFKTQLRAAFRASPYGKLQIMFPMIGSVEDFRSAKAVADGVLCELAAEGFALKSSVPLGIMVEIPAAALAAEALAKEADFASIGTNDLCQYTFAADRMNAAVAGFVHPISVPILRLIRQTAEAFKAQGKPVSVCGELASDENAIHLLLGCGVEKLSVTATALGKVKRIISAAALSDCEVLFQKAVTLSTEQEILELVDAFERNNGTR